MKRHFRALGLVLAAQTMLFTVPAAFAQDAVSQTQPASQDDPSLTRQALEWSQDRLAELDATIAVIERDVARLQGEARARAEAALKTLREKRDAYRTRADEAVANARTWTDTQVAEARKSIDESWTAFHTARDGYLDAAKADLATRRAVLEAELDARQKAWRKSIDELRARTEKLAADQRAAIDARIAALNAQLDEAKARLGRLQDASDEAWQAVKRDFAETQKRLSDTYASIRKSIEDATK
jgi:chromosome segregation ATPase